LSILISRFVVAVRANIAERIRRSRDARPGESAMLLVAFNDRINASRLNPFSFKAVAHNPRRDSIQIDSANLLRDLATSNS
jgi:hypothetical protein